MLMNPDRRRVDHLDVAVVSLGNRVQKPVPNARLAPAVEAVHAGRVRAVAGGDVSPGRARAQPPEDPVQHAPVIDARNPRGLFGNNGWITHHSKSVRSKRAMRSSFEALESGFDRFVNPFYEYVT
jgi:hypothetical protein